ncbi:hypothetical protein FEM48_ZijujUnG0118500 [Ziziphus jujuba var. spinosa]|uniref:Lipoyl-binding domain-containing protein n=1 Tax=Ziziphus jujuba var. spinosa TaxID=714518 RepID=A0A978U7W9_ZIZJJ|nr:hypothetical protein FEM48_ZijujUnG0118500 [Ziziphus jujuba var. spinosa]
MNIFGSAGAVSNARSLLVKSGVVPMHNACGPTPSGSCIQSSTVSKKLIYSPKMQKTMLISCVKTSEAKETSKSNGEAVSSDSIPQGSLEKTPRSATFPNGFELFSETPILNSAVMGDSEYVVLLLTLQALMLEVCDETEIAELKLKVGDFEMHLKRNVGATTTPLSSISPTTPPPIPSKPMVESTPAAPPPSPPKSSSEKTSPFKNVASQKISKLAALEASGTSGYILVSSPTVGKFQRGRTVKEKRQPPICKEGDIIKEGQVIGYVEQFGTELPVKSDVGGEVFKILFNDEEAVGYGDPLVAILPSFHGINIK